MQAQLKDVRKIWDRAPHNAMTDLLRFRDRWICVFREGEGHVSPDGCIRVLHSADGVAWESAALIAIPGLDLRDPKITVTPAGSLMLHAAGEYYPPDPWRHQSFAWFSPDGTDWRTAVRIGDPNYWLWRITWNRNVAYTIGYRTVDPPGTRLYASTDGIGYDPLVDALFQEEFPNEASIAFDADDTALCLLRRDAGTATALLGRALPPYRAWEWKSLGVRIGGPNMCVLPDGRIVAAVRRYGKEPWTSLNWLDPEQCTLNEFLALPSGGDTSYAGLCWRENMLWVSYYSSHEGHACIYLARICI